MTSTTNTVTGSIYFLNSMPRALSQRLLGPGYGQDRVTFSLAPGTLAQKQHAVVDAYVFDRSGGREVIGEVTLAEQLARQSMYSLAVLRSYVPTR